MKLTVVLENTAVDRLSAAHGLSLYLEVGEHKILFDAGPDSVLLQKNADTLGIDLSDVTLAMLSHGHYDHAGGLRGFFERNSNAPLYLHRLADQPYYASENVGFRYIGMDPQIREEYAARFRPVDDQLVLGENLTFFSDIKTGDLLPSGNSSLLEPSGEAYIPDRFLHELNLLIRDNGKLILIAGCAHRGIVNIIRRAEEIAGRAPDAVFSGFHLTNPGKGIDEPEENIRAVAAALCAWPCRYFTGHCTGKGPFAILKECLGDRLEYLGGGKTFEV